MKETTKTMAMTMTTLVLVLLAKHDSIKPSLVSCQSDQTGAKPSLGFFLQLFFLHGTTNISYSSDAVPVPGPAECACAETEYRNNYSHGFSCVFCIQEIECSGYIGFG